MLFRTTFCYEISGIIETVFLSVIILYLLFYFRLCALLISRQTIANNSCLKNTNIKFVHYPIKQDQLN